MISFEHDDKGCCQHQCDTTQEQHDTTPAGGELATCKEKLAKTEEQMRYLAADFENFRRNVTKERAQWARLAQIKIFEDVVGIVDDFNRAIADFQKNTEVSEAEKARFAGVELVYKNFMKFFEQHGVIEVPTNIAFNPELHEALIQVEAEGKEAGTIVDVLQKGYMLKETVIRPAKVSVAK